MGGASDAGIKSPHHPAHGPLQLHIHLVGSNVAFGGHLQGPLNGHHIMDRGDNKISLGNLASLDDIIMDEGAPGGLNQAVTLTIPRGVAYFRLFPVKGFGEDFQRPLQGVRQLMILLGMLLLQGMNIEKY